MGYDNIGHVLAAYGKLHDALDAYQEELTVAKRLTQQNRSNSDWQQCLSWSYERIGDGMLAQGLLQDALNAYKQELTIDETLAGQDPNTLNKLNEIANALTSPSSGAENH